MTVLVCVSGCRELNPVYIHPMDAYYRYTTARLRKNVLAIFPYNATISRKNQGVATFSRNIPMQDPSFLPYVHALRCVPGIGSRTLETLVRTAHPELIWNETAHLPDGMLPTKSLESLRQMRRTFDVTSEWQKLMESGISCLWHESEGYPPLLREIPDSPALLYLAGETAPLLDRPCVAIVGTRKPTSYGKQAAWNLSRDLASSGITIVSGLALGLDSTAHEAALECGGSTVAVLGSGLDEAQISPRSHLDLAHRIVRSGGAILSEYPPDTPAGPGTFPARNRIIAGLSLATIVIEASLESGTLITANLALDYNRDVFAVPGSIFSRLSDGSNNLLRQGAKVATSSQDILESLPSAFALGSKEPKTDPETLPPHERAVYLSLAAESTGIDSLVRSTKLDTATVSASVSMLEMKGIVRNVGQGKYAIV